MKPIRRWTALLAGLMLSSVPMACGRVGNADLVLKPDPADTARINDGVFEGWGTSLCWWANRIGYSDSLSGLAAEAFCDAEKGLGLNILRYNIGGGDHPDHDHITRTDSMMPGFWKDPVRDPESGEWTWTYDWSQDAAQRNVLEKCLEAGGDGMMVEGFSNSPPWFLTNSGCTSGAADPGSNNLREDAYDAFARYLAEVADHFAGEWGIRFQSMSPMNEPDTNYWGAFSKKQEGCHFDPGESQSRILVALSEQLSARGLSDIQIAGTDETSIDTQASSLNRLSPEALKAISRVDTHSYGGSGRARLRTLALEKGKNLWMSEVDGGETLGKGAGEMGAGLWLARRITEDLNGLTPSAWILWQVIDSHICREGYLGRRDTGMVNTSWGYWGTAVADHDRQELVLTMKYYVLGQYTRFIRPGSHLIAVSGPAVAALDGEGRSLSLVIYNQEAEKRTLRVDLSAFSDLFPAGCRVESTRTSGSMAEGEHWAELPAGVTEDGGFRAELAPFSVTSFRIKAP